MNWCKKNCTPQYFFGMLWQWNGPLKKDHSGNFVCIQYQPNVHYTIVGFVKIPSDDNIENNSSVLMFHVKSKQFSTMMSSFKISDRAWKYHQTRISQDAYLCKMWYVKLVAQNCTYFSAAQKKTFTCAFTESKKLDLEGNKFRRFNF